MLIVSNINYISKEPIHYARTEDDTITQKQEGGVGGWGIKDGGSLIPSLWMYDTLTSTHTHILYFSFIYFLCFFLILLLFFLSSINYITSFSTTFCKIMPKRTLKTHIWAKQYTNTHFYSIRCRTKLTHTEIHTSSSHTHAHKHSMYMPVK